MDLPVRKIAHGQFLSSNTQDFIEVHLKSLVKREFTAIPEL